MLFLPIPKKATPMRNRLQPFLCLLGIMATAPILTGCNDTLDLAPDAPDHAWHPDVSTQQASGHHGLVIPKDVADHDYSLPADPDLPVRQTDILPDKGHPYSLPELIDLAERNNKQTRIAWEQARQAAIGVGLSQASYLPQISASILGGYNRLALPLPSYLSQRGYMTSDSEAIYPKLTLSYLLFDFGARDAGVREARNESYASNVMFNAAHQRLLLGVSRAYYALDAATANLASARQALDNANLLLRAAQARRDNGESTIVDLEVARRNAAQADYQLQQAVAMEHSAHYELLDAMGLPATTALTVSGSAEKTLPPAIPGHIHQLMEEALRQRPDIQAGLARLRAANAAVDVAHASLMPRISIGANVEGYIGQMRTRGTDLLGTPTPSPNAGIVQPEGGAFMQFDWPIFMGGQRTNEIRLSESRAAQAKDTLEQQTDTATREVATTEDALQTSLSQVSAAMALRAAADRAFRAAAQAYAHGVGTLTDASSTASALRQAQAAYAQSHAQALTNAVALAFVTGSLTGTP